MAYMSQEKKAVIAQELNKALEGTGVKFSLAVRHHSTIVCTFKEGPIDFIKNYNETKEEGCNASGIEVPPAKDHVDVNVYHAGKAFTGMPRDVILQALNKGNWDRSDSQTDYFDVGHYVDLKIGRFDRPYLVK